MHLSDLLHQLITLTYSIRSFISSTHNYIKGSHRRAHNRLEVHSSSTPWTCVQVLLHHVNTRPEEPIPTMSQKSPTHPRHWHLTDSTPGLCLSQYSSEHTSLCWLCWFICLTFKIMETILTYGWLSRLSLISGKPAFDWHIRYFVTTPSLVHWDAELHRYSYRSRTDPVEVTFQCLKVTLAVYHNFPLSSIAHTDEISIPLHRESELLPLASLDNCNREIVHFLWRMQEKTCFFFPFSHTDNSFSFPRARRDTKSSGTQQKGWPLFFIWTVQVSRVFSWVKLMCLLCAKWLLLATVRAKLPAQTGLSLAYSYASFKLLLNKAT